MKKNKIYILILLSFIFCFILFFSYKYIERENNSYELYANFTRASDVMALSFNKNLDIQYYTIRNIQSSNHSLKETRGSLIKDFSNYNIIPILNYLNKESEDEELIKSFTKFTIFLGNYNAATIGNRENIFVAKENGKYYSYEDGIYTYKTKKKILNRNFFKNKYNEYLKSINENDIETHFIKELYKLNNIKKKYSFKQLKSKIKKDYSVIYNEFENDIISIISNDLNDFSEFLSSKTLKIEENSLPYLIINIQSDEEDDLSLEYNFTVLDRIYDPVSKYYKYSYQLDIDSVWNQLKEKNYPKLYF